MREVCIVGAGITPCKGRWIEKTYYGLAQMAVKATVENAAISIKDVDAVVYGYPRRSTPSTCSAWCGQWS